MKHMVAPNGRVHLVRRGYTLCGWHIQADWGWKRIYDHPPDCRKCLDAKARYEEGVNAARPSTP